MKKQYLRPRVLIDFLFEEDVMALSGNDPWGDDIYAPQSEGI